MTTDGPIEGSENDDTETGSPGYEIVDHSPVEFAAMVSGLLEREWTDEEFELGDAGVFPLNGLWALSPANWDPQERAERWTDHPVLVWANDFRDALIDLWGEPEPFVPRTDPDTGEPEGIVAYLLASLGAENAVMWRHAQRTVLLVFRWTGEPGASRFDLLQLIVPEAILCGGVETLITEDSIIEPALLHGEELTELHRRAALASFVAGPGEETVLTPADGEVSATRCGYRVDRFTWAHWIFTSDSRAVLLILHTRTRGLLDPDDEDTDEGAVIEQLSGLYSGVPEDLLDLVARPASSVRGRIGSIGEFQIGDRRLPQISGAFWFDGEQWRPSTGLVVYGNTHGVGYDDVGFDDAVRRPLRLGGDFAPEHLLFPGHVDLTDPAETESALSHFIEAFETSPNPPGVRPQGLIRLGTAVPADSVETILDDIESTAAGWWEAGLAAYDRAGPFTIAGRPANSFGRRELTAHLGHADEWNAEVFTDWIDSLIAGATSRWGRPFPIDPVDPETGRPIRNGSARALRGYELGPAPAWWVNGVVVSFGHGAPPRWELVLDGWHLPTTRPGPMAFIQFHPVDAVIDPLRGTRVDDVRFRVRTVAALMDVEPRSVAWDSTPIGYRANDAEKPSDLFEHTTAEAIRWVLPAPLLARPSETGGVEVDSAGEVVSAAIDHGYHAWHFTHDNRALLLTWSENSPFNVLGEQGADGRGPVTFGGASTAFEKQAALYEGLPEDLLSLVTDQPGDSPLRTVTDDEGRTLSAATGVLWHDGVDWIVPVGLLNAVREYVAGAEGASEAPDGAPITASTVLMGGADGFATAGFVIAAGEQFDTSLILDDAHYSSIVFGEVPLPEDVLKAFDSFGTVEQVVTYGSLQGFLDVRVHATEWDRLVPAALSNPDPRSRRDLFLWLLGSGASATEQYSRASNLTILLDNEVLDPISDAVLVTELIARGGTRMVSSVAPRVRGGGHPLVQLCDRDLDEETLEPLYQAVFDGFLVAAERERFPTPDLDALLGLDSPLGPQGQSADEYLMTGDFPHSHDRSMLLKHLETCRREMRQAWMDDQERDEDVADEPSRSAAED